MLKREALVEQIKALSDNIEANVKFITLLYSRLMEDGVSPDNAIFICNSVNFDFSNVPEDDDTLSDIATEYSSYCVRVLNKIQLHGYLTPKKLPMFASLFGNFKLEVDH